MNTSTAFQRYLVAGMCAASVMVLPALAASNQISAQLDRLSLSLGESAQLAITVKGSQPTEPTVPPVDGLEITSVGQQSSMRVMNGAVSAEVRYLYQVTPNRPGNFTIPAIGLSGGGSTRPIAFQVDNMPRGQSSSPPGTAGSLLPAPNVTRAEEGTTEAEAIGQQPFLRVVLPKQELIVGELVPVQIKACFPPGMTASLNGLPVLTGGAFALNKLDDNPKQTREVIDGRPYNVITWSSALSAVQAGDYPLRLELPVIVRVQERTKPSGSNPFKDFFGDASPFDDSIVDDFFAQTTEKPLTMRSDGATLKIQPLPVQGRPAEFSGAVGLFDVRAEASATSAMSGDPIALKMKISGRGNFDRVTTNGLEASVAWRSYKPSVRFEPADREGLTGVKTFEQAIVPTRLSPSEIPGLSFTYFDPETRSYVTKTTAPIPVQIVPGIANASPLGSPTTPAAAHSTDRPIPDDAEIGPVASLRPVVLAPWFLISNASMAVATAIGLLIIRRQRRLANDPERLRATAATAAVRRALAAMDESIKNLNVTEFFLAARKAVVECLAERWSLPANQVTPAEIRTRLNDCGEEICALFKRGDEVSFGHQEVTAGELTQWRATVAQQLARL
jgi:hypothetical protein